MNKSVECLNIIVPDLQKYSRILNIEISGFTRNAEEGYQPSEGHGDGDREDSRRGTLDSLITPHLLI